MPDPTADYLALRRQAGAVWLARDVVRVTGPDALSFLQGQLSQDLPAIPMGRSALSFVLQPQGRVDALVRVTREADDSLLLDLDGGWGEALVARLERFKLRVKVEITTLGWRCLAIRGPFSSAAVAGLADAHATLILRADWPGLPGVDLLGESPAVPAGIPLCSHDAYEAVRIEAGVPVMGAELTERTIPAEAGIVEEAVSFTKGCFTGQELVARIDSRGGNVPRRLRGVVVLTNVIPPVGAVVEVDGREAATLTSVAESLDRRAPVALAYVRRDVEPPADAVVVVGGGGDGERRLPARIESLPLVS